MTDATRVMIADDHGVMRDGLRALINGQADMTVVAEVDNATDVIPAALEAEPDILLLDISMPGGGGLPVIGELRKTGCKARVVVLTMHEQPAYLRRALAAGASGYIAKRVASTQLLNAIRAVASGDTQIDESLLGEPGSGDIPIEEPPLKASSALSGREQEVLRHVASGYTNQETADKLGLSVKTVEGYRSRMSRKIGARGRADLVRYALQSGLLEGPP